MISNSLHLTDGDQKYATSTYYSCFYRFVNAVNNNSYFNIEFSPNKVDQYTSSWNQNNGGCINGTIGALDATEIRYNSSANSFYNYKKFKSIKVIALVNSKHEFIHHEIAGPGSTQDPKAFERSNLFKTLTRIFNTIEKANQFKLNQNNIQIQTDLKFEQKFILTDGGFSTYPFSLKPYRRNQIEKGYKEFFNKIISGNRIVVEQTFGELKMVFGILQRPLRCSYQNSLCIIDSIFRLHNFRLEVFNKERKTIEERMSILGKRIEYKFKEYILKNYNELDQD